MKKYYAEYLPRIGVISILIELSSSINSKELKLYLKNQKVLCLDTQNEPTTSINLPCSTVDSCVKNASILSSNKKVYTISVRLNAVKDMKLASQVSFSQEKNIPWNAQILFKHTDEIWFDCKKCSSEIIPRKKISFWRALPSEHWAEMFDFWHCHKPFDSSDPEPANKTYSVSNFSATIGTGLVGDVYFLMNNSDINSKVHNKLVLCESCGENIGNVTDYNSNCLKIWKWSLSVKSSCSNGIKNYPISAFICVLLNELIESHANYTCLVYKQGSNTPFIALWIQNPDILFTSSANKEGQKAIKLLYVIEKDFPKSFITKDLERITLPNSIVDNLYSILSASHETLPIGVKSFSFWNAAVLKCV